MTCQTGEKMNPKLSAWKAKKQPGLQCRKAQKLVAQDN